MVDVSDNSYVANVLHLFLIYSITGAKVVNNVHLMRGKSSANPQDKVIMSPSMGRFLELHFKYFHPLESKLSKGWKASIPQEESERSS